jgi:hypothetical protein
VVTRDSEVVQMPFQHLCFTQAPAFAMGSCIRCRERDK